MLFSFVVFFDSCAIPRSLSAEQPVKMAMLIMISNFVRRVIFQSHFLPVGIICLHVTSQR